MLRVRRRSTIRSLSLVLAVALSGSWLVAPTPAGARSDHPDPNSHEGSLGRPRPSRATQRDLGQPVRRRRSQTGLDQRQYHHPRRQHREPEGQRGTRSAPSSTPPRRRWSSRWSTPSCSESPSRRSSRCSTRTSIESEAERIYQDQVIGNLNALEAKLQREKTSLEHTVAKVANQRARVASQRVKAQHQTYAMKALLESEVALQNQTQAELASVTAQYRMQIINYEIAQGVIAAQAITTLPARNRPSPPRRPSAVRTPPTRSSRRKPKPSPSPPSPKWPAPPKGTAAVKAAESQIGVPYVWGGETPGRRF